MSAAPDSVWAITPSGFCGASSGIRSHCCPIPGSGEMNFSNMPRRVATSWMADAEDVADPAVPLAGGSCCVVSTKLSAARAVKLALP